MGKRQCLDVGMEIRLLPQPAGLSVLGSVGPARLRALMVLTWGPLYHLQAGAESREGEGCGAVGLLLEHSFEIGESSNVLTRTLTQCPVSGTRVPLSVRYAIHSLTALHLGVCLHYTGEVGAAANRSSVFEDSHTCKTNASFRKVGMAVITSEATLTNCPMPFPSG